MASEMAQPAILGRRERNKLDKRQRIVAAAQALFRVQGYETTTTREIAVAADVGAGTLFTYAQDKRDLLLMILNDHLETVVPKSTDAGGSTLAKRLVEMYRPNYEFFAQERGIAISALREISVLSGNEADPSPEVERLFRRRHRTRERVGEILVATVGAIAEHDKDLVVTILTGIQNANVRFWLASDELTPAAGLRRLGAQFELVTAGFAALGPADKAS